MSMFDKKPKDNPLPEGDYKKEMDDVIPPDQRDKSISPGVPTERKCECGAPYKINTTMIGGTPLNVPEPTCDCRQKRQQQWDQEEQEKKDKAVYIMLLGDSNIPDWCKKKEYNIPDEDEYQEDAQEEVVVQLEYRKFLRIKDNLPWHLKTYAGIFVPGNPGTRKTTYVCELGKQAMRVGKNVKYYQAAELITKKVNIWDLVQPAFLIIDDLGNDAVENRNNLLWTLVNKRIDERKFTAIITNYPMEHNRSIFGDAFMDRLKLFLPVVMIGESSRTHSDEQLSP